MPYGLRRYQQSRQSHVAARDSAGQDYYIFSDHLGSARVITNATGTVCGDTDYLPFGAEKVTSTCWVNYKFATYERDPETGLDYAIFRYYNSRLGRFMSPDLLAGGVDDPQSLNRYAYVLNDPVNRYDPLGLDWIWGWGWGGAWDWGGGVGGGPNGGFGILPGDLVIPPPLSIQELIQDWLGLSECSNASAAFLPNCGGTFDGIPVFSFGENGPFKALGDLYIKTAIDKCKANVTQMLVDYYNKGKTTGLGEGAAHIGIHLGTDKALEHAPPKVGIVGSILGLVYAVRDIPAWFKQELEANRAYSAAGGLCEAAFGKP